MVEEAVDRFNDGTLTTPYSIKLEYVEVVISPTRINIDSNFQVEWQEGIEEELEKNFDDFLKDAHDQADKINQQAQDKNISKDIDKEYER